MSLSDIYDTATEMFQFANHLGEMRGKNVYFCKECGTELRIAYLENRIYLVVCPWCEILHLLKDTYPEKALKRIGQQAP